MSKLRMAAVAAPFDRDLEAAFGRISQLIEQARACPVPAPPLPPHLVENGDRRLAQLLSEVTGRPIGLNEAATVFSRTPAALFERLE